MATSLGALVIDLLARTGQFETDTGRAARIAEKRSREIERSFDRMGKRVTRALAGLAAGFSFAAIIRSTSEAEKAMAALENAVRNNAGAAGFTTPQLAKMSSELQSLTTYSDEAVQEAQGLLLAFRQIGGPEFNRAQVAVLDLATALNKDLSSSATLVGRALADPVKGMTALSRAGVVLEKDQQKLIKRLAETGQLSQAQGILLKELENRFGGAATAARNTFGGALTGLKNAFGDLLEAKTGMPGAVDSLNELSALLQDPATVAAANTLISGLVTGFAAAGKAIAEFAGGIKTLSEDFAAIRFGAASDDLVRLEDQLGRVQRMMESGAIFGEESRLTFFGKDGIVKWYSDSDLASEMKRLTAQIDAARSNANAGTVTGAAGGTGTGSLGGSSAPSDEFTKLQAQLQQQISLYGKVGEAAKIAFQIQSGALEELSSSEQAQVLALARQYDAIVKSVTASKELEATRKKSSEEIAKLTTSLEQEVSLYGRGALATIEYRIAHGDLAETFKSAGPEADKYKHKLLDMTLQMEGLAAQTEMADKRLADFKQIMSDGASVIEATRTPLEKFNAEIERLNKLRDANALGGDSAETYKRAVEAAQDALEKASQDGDKFAEQFKDGIFRSLGDGIYSAMTDGAKRGWKGFLDAGLETINRLVAQALAKRLAEGLFGDGKSGSSGGWIAGAGKILGSIFGGGRASGGPVTSGMLYRINEREPEFFRPNTGGQVVPLSKMPSAGGAHITQNIMVQGRSDLRTARQMQVEAARQQRIATARLG